ncbi:MAG TPA: MOSC domain-containing protein [Streptosporangiaceae bacterium]|jgi:MOSC domain-containing protein YiiM
MATARVMSVSTGKVRDTSAAGGMPPMTAIDKRPRRDRVAVRTLGLDGDEQGDTVNHGGRDQAVYAYAREDLDWWVERLGYELRDGIFGENVTTAGLDVTGAVIGETWRLGTAVVQVTSPRIPCATFQGWLDEERWVKRFAAAGRPGAYLRVLREGLAGPGDGIEVLSRPPVLVTLPESMRAYYGDAELMRKLLEVEGRGSKWDAISLRVLAQARA